ncbi:YbjN domain-containing protein [Laspinema sp. D6]|nr:YbjN domain-containing protein [Laspinema sp. D3a]
MNAKSDNFPLKQDFTFYDPSSKPLTIYATQLILTWQEEQLRECRLEFKVNQELYQRIDTETLFNLKTEVRGSFSEKFHGKSPIFITATLQPDLLPAVQEKLAGAEDTAAVWVSLSPGEADSTLWVTKNWYALSVTQTQNKKKVGYRTFWDAIDLFAMTQPETTKDDFFQALLGFFQSEIIAPSSKDTPESRAQSRMFETLINTLKDLSKENRPLNLQESEVGDRLGESIVNLLQEWAETTDSVMAETGNATDAEAAEPIIRLFQEAAASSVGFPPPEASENPSVFETIINFFKQDDWVFVEIPGESTLRVAFQGDNGQWNCYAQAIEEQKRFVFYSLVPVPAPENKRLAIAEAIARANYGMGIGNFELAWDTGEIRFKTSIDFEGAVPNSGAIAHLVYLNVLTMDKYLPGIMQVIYSNLSPAQVIAAIEN